MAEPRSRYSLVSIVLHWTIAGLIVWNILLGWSADDLRGVQKFETLQLHKSIGLTVLALALARLAWRLVNPAPPLPAHMKGWERFAARATHVLFYVLMIGVPLGGWAIVSAHMSHIPTRWFGLFTWPDLPLPRSRPLAHQIAEAHGLGAWVIIVTLGLHVLAALKHQFVDRDVVLWRMLPIFPKPRERA